jgi:SAM-dependent methyltransferase
MGISISNAALLMAANAKGIAFSHTATLGVQTFWPDSKQFDYLLKIFNWHENAESIFKKIGNKGSLFFKYLGAESVIEIDASSYEGAQVIHDMNTPIPDSLVGKFDCVFDGGTLEHIYDFPQAVENIFRMLKKNGTFISSTIANNIMGHGFYQFSPELFYRVFSETNGWNTKTVMLCEHQLTPPQFWRVDDPLEVGSRLEVQNSSQLYLMIITQKVREELLFQSPQQSDYAVAWNSGNDVLPTEAPAALIINKIIKRIRKKLNITSVFPKLPETLVKKAKGLNQNGIHKISLKSLKDL